MRTASCATEPSRTIRTVSLVFGVRCSVKTEHRTPCLPELGQEGAPGRTPAW
jgi:hypothetical protein